MRWAPLFLTVMWFSAACSGDVAGDGDVDPQRDADAETTLDAGSATDADGGGDAHDDGGDTDSGGGDAGALGELDGLRCSSGATGCAESGPYFDDTCCAAGDALQRVGSGRASEAVDIETNESYAVLCGGFGAVVFDIRDPETPRSLGSVASRCQHAALAADGAGTQLLYLAHHGDSWVSTPTLWIYRIHESGALEQLSSLHEEDVFYEGLRYSDGHLYVAAHDGGLRVYRAESAGDLELLSTLRGLGNAWKVEVDDDVAYVVDNDGSLHVVSVADPARPELRASVETSGPPRDVAIRGDLMVVALGGLGIDIFDNSDPVLPRRTGGIETLGSAQSVALGDGVIAVAAWSHVATYDSESLTLLATEKTRSRGDFEQDLGVEMEGDLVFVAEWEGLHVYRHRPGYVGAELWLDEEAYDFEATEIDARAVIVRNLGRLPLIIHEISVVDDGSLTLDRSSLRVEPRDAGVFEMTFTPPAEGPWTVLELESNDVDEDQAVVVVVTSASERINVGDELTEAFAFLDPSGAGQLSGLEGHVIVLSYFALF